MDIAKEISKGLADRVVIAKVSHILSRDSKRTLLAPIRELARPIERSPNAYGLACRVVKLLRRSERIAVVRICMSYPDFGQLC